jgi:hypothetical protein
VRALETDKLVRATWRTVSYSQGNGSCVEGITDLRGERIAVRDTKPRSTDAFSRSSVLSQVSAPIGAVGDCASCRRSRYSALAMIT